MQQIVPVLLMLLSSIRTKFILINTLHPGNVGAAARAIKTMGFDELCLVAPKDPKVLNRKQTKDGASGAVDILERAQVVQTLQEALEDMDVCCATGMPHDMHQQRRPQTYMEPRPYLGSILANQEKNSDMLNSIAFVFGNERSGMQDQDFAYCHVVLGIPTNPSFGSLNLASAVQLIAYDWRQAMGGFSLSNFALE